MTENLPQICFQCQDQTIQVQKYSNKQASGESCNNMTIPKVHCGICTKTIAKNHRKIICQVCKSHIHIKCNNTDVNTYNKIMKLEITLTCYKCQSEDQTSQILVVRSL